MQVNRAIVARSRTRQIILMNMKKPASVVRRTQDALKERASTSHDLKNSQLFAEFVDHVRNRLRSFYGLHISQDCRASVARIQQDFVRRLVVTAPTTVCDQGFMAV